MGSDLRRAGLATRDHASRAGGSRKFAGEVCRAPVWGNGYKVLGLPEQIRATLFDLDGVLTDTASVHKKAWKSMFDAFLKTERSARASHSCRSTSMPTT